MKVASTIFYVLGIICFAVAALNVSQAPNIQYLIGTFLPGLLCIIIGLALGKTKKEGVESAPEDEILDVISADEEAPRPLLQLDQKRANSFKFHANLGILAGIFLIFLAGGIAKGEQGRFPIAWLISLGGFAWLIWGCVNYMRWKGYSGWFGFFGYLFLPGLIVLLCFPNRRKQILHIDGQEQFRQLKALAKEDRKRGFRFLLTLAPVVFFGFFFGTYLLLLRSNVAAAEWQQVAPDGMGFQVLMPGAPLLEQNAQESPVGTVDIRKYTVWTKGNREFFMIVLVRFPEQIGLNVGGPEKILELGRQDVISASKAQLKSQRNIVLNGLPGLELELTNSGNAIKVRIFATNNQVYEVWAHILQIRSPSDDVQKFFDSFKLTNEPARSPE